MAEIEIAGAKIKGSKLLLVLPVVSAIAGGLLASFEFYKDYTNIQDIIANIDTGQVNARMLVINTKLDEALDYSRDIKNGLRDDIVRLEKIIDKVEDDINEVETKTRTLIDDAETRFDTKCLSCVSHFVVEKCLAYILKKRQTSLIVSLGSMKRHFPSPGTL